MKKLMMTLLLSAAAAMAAQNTPAAGSKADSNAATTNTAPAKVSKHHRHKAKPVKGTTANSTKSGAAASNAVPAKK